MSTQKIVQQYNQTGNVSNQVVTQEFVQAIKQWVLYDDAIKDANNKLKVYRIKKKELGGSIQTYMKKNHIENHDINITGGGKVRYRTSNRMVPVNKEYIYKRALVFFKGDKKTSEDLVNFIFKDRERIPSNTLSRTRPRQKKK